jgi:hypothetical protein
MKIQAFASCVSSCILLFACNVGVFVHVFSAHLVTLAVAGFNLNALYFKKVLCREEQYWSDPEFALLMWFIQIVR